VTTLNKVGLAKRLGRLPNLTVTVFGDFSVDAYWSICAGTDQVSVETGLPVQEVSRQRYGLGGAGDVASAVVALGVGVVRAVGVCGQDPFGPQMLRDMDALGIVHEGMIVLPPPWETLVYAKPYVGAKEGSRLDFGSMGELPEGTVELLAGLFEEAARASDAVIINQQIRSGLYTPQLIDRINAAIAANPGTVFVVDTRNLGVPFPTAVLKLNCREATAFFGEQPLDDIADEDAMVLARQIADATHSAVFLTRGANGLVVASGEDVQYVLPIDTGPKVDTVGAGDVVTATIAALMAAGAGATEAAQAANLAASVSVRVLQATGTDAVTPSAVLRALDDDVIYAPGLADDPTRATLITGTEYELVPPDQLGAGNVEHVIFDHDGTLSTLRQGWEDIMAPMMLRAVLGPMYGKTRPSVVSDVKRQIAEFIDRTTGIQTLVQMKGLIDLVREWGFVPDDEILDEHGYKAIYNDLLLQRVQVRINKIRLGQLAREDFHIKNAIPLLRALRDAGLVLHLASGTDQADVIAEANELGFGEFFGERIYGSTGHIEHDAKKVVIDGIISQIGLDGSKILTFGDGPVEMRETRRIGGTSVGVCSDEIRRYGFNMAKRRRLIRGGAHLLIPDFSDLDSLFRVLGLDARPSKAKY